MPQRTVELRETDRGDQKRSRPRENLRAAAIHPYCEPYSGTGR
jgi:hypothetical protein